MTQAPDRTSKLFGLALAGLDQARRLGHVLGTWTRDDYLTLAARCDACDLWLVVTSDRDEPVQIDGSCSVLPCTKTSGAEPYWAAPPTAAEEGVAA